MDRKSWGPPSWTGSQGGRHLGPEVMGAAILDLTSWGPPSWTGSDVIGAIVAPILLWPIILANESLKCPAHAASQTVDVMYKS